MYNKMIKKGSLRQKRAWRVRNKIKGTAARPRLCVYKSNAHISAQLIDDEAGVTLGSVATFSKEFRKDGLSRNKTSAKQLGERLGEIAKQKHIKEVIFDRGPFKYHGVLAELADAARATGLKF